MSMARRVAVGIASAIIVGGAIFALAAAGGRFARAPKVPAYRIKTPAGKPLIFIEEYTDLQCPACSFANKTLNSLLDVYGDNMRVVFRHSPLSIHKWSVPAAIAAECAGRQGKFFEYADKLYQTQTDWAESKTEPAQFAAYAAALGLDAKTFASCRADPAVAEIIKGDSHYAESRGIDATPTFFVNGRQADGAKGLLEEAAGFEALVRGGKQ